MSDEAAAIGDGRRCLTLNRFVDDAGCKSTRSWAAFLKYELVSRDLVVFLSDEDFSELLVIDEPVGLRILRFSIQKMFNFHSKKLL